MVECAFLVAGVAISGGTAVVFEHALQLVSSGHRVTILTRDPVSRPDLSWHRIGASQSANLRWKTLAEASSERFDVAIATYWVTVFDLWRIDARSYAYFAQSIESRFVAEQERAVRALTDATYDLPLVVITEAKWIVDYLSKVHDRPAHYVPNGIDKQIFCSAGTAIAPRIPGRLRVLVEGPTDVWFKNVPKTVALCRAAGADEVWLLTSSAVQSFPGVDRVFSQIPMNAVAEVYRGCDVIVKLSYVEGMFGPPLEMFHCGGACVVYDVTGHDEYIVHGFNGLVAHRDDDAAVADYLRQLRAQPTLLAALRQNAAQTAAQWPTWETSSQAFAAALEDAVRAPTITREALRAMTRRLWTLFDHGQREMAERLAAAAASAAALEAASRSIAIAEPALIPSSAVVSDGLAETKLAAALSEAEADRKENLATYEQLLRSTSWRIVSWTMRKLGAHPLGALRGGEILQSRADLMPVDARDLRHRILSIYNSTCWDLLAPMRLLSRILRRVSPTRRI